MGRNYCAYFACFVGRRIEKTMDSQSKVKNIIFDLGCILVELYPQRCIDSFRSLGAEAVAKYIETHQTRDLFYHIEVGKITNAAFCEAVRELTELPLKDEEIESAWNSLIGTIPEHKLQAIKELAKTHQCLFLVTPTQCIGRVVNLCLQPKRAKTCCNSFKISSYLTSFSSSNPVQRSFKRW